MSENQRLKELQKILGFQSQEKFATALHIKQGSLSDIYREKGGIKVSDSIKRILDKEYSISLDWLERGEGEVFNTEEPTKTNLPMLEGKLVADDEESYANALSKYEGSLVPEYSLEFRGGQEGAVLSPEHLVGHWFIPNAPKGTFMITMVGQSMMPDIKSGSRLLLMPMSFDQRHPTSIPFGNVFGVVLSNEDQTEYSAHIKILRRHTDANLERTHWIARSINREQYDDFDIPIKQVTHLYKVIACIDNLWSF